MSRAEDLRGASTRQAVEVAREADVDIQDGLSDAEAARRMVTDGANAHRSQRPPRP